MLKSCRVYILLVVLALFFSCKDDKYTSSPDDVLSFSADTIAFDTVFSTVGSTTKKLMVYNRNDENIRISSIRLNGGEKSPFRINVDGFSGTSFGTTEIFRKDSMYVFVEVTINPNDETLPFLVTDTITFLTNSVTQKIILEAYGQNAVIFKNYTITHDTTLTAEKPFLVYGTLCVQKDKKLKISKNCKFYFHKNAMLEIGGPLLIEGTTDEPVLFRADRLDKFLKDYKYDDLPGQWGGIRLMSETATYSVKNAIVRNGHTAFFLQGNDENQPILNIENSIIENFDSCGICAKQAKINISNSLLADCRVNCISLTGGELQVEQTTIANNFVNLASTDTRSGASVLLANYFTDEKGEKKSIPLNKANFVNCVVWGTYNNEFSLKKSDDETVGFDYKFSSSLLKTEKQKEDDEHFADVIFDNPNFVSEKFPHDYHLSEYSIARDTLIDLPVAQKFPFDLDGNNRFADGKPDLGAYEYVKPTENE